MQKIVNPSKESWGEILKRPVLDASSLEERIIPVLHKVKNEGDKALFEFTKTFDGVELTDLLVSKAEFDEASSLVSEELKAAINYAKKNIEVFHEAQQTDVVKIETTPGVVCWRESRAIDKVGLYIPGGTAPLFSTILMLVIPAKIAGCKEIVLCTPPNKEGKVHPAILYTANLLGVSTLAKVGGSQAIAAMAYGTESVPQVYKIFGPGNQYVTGAKQLVNKEGIAIDMPAGPSEVAVVADETANPAFVAADLLSQAEHGIDSQVILLSTSEAVVDAVIVEINKQVEELPRKEMALKALENSRSIVISSMDDMIDMMNDYAPEHLILEVANYDSLISRVQNAGSVFLGHYTPESAGDYASGTNHTLPTNGYAMAYSGVSLDSFVKKITFQEISKSGIQQLGRTIEVMAEEEQLIAHKNAVTLRLKD